MEKAISRTQADDSGSGTWFRSLFDDRLQALALILAFAPIFSGLIFRTYSWHVTPGGYEALRQMDVPFILFEMAIIFWAHIRGLSFSAMFSGLDKSVRWALIAFLATFWISSILIAPNPAYSALRASFWFIHIAFGFAVFHLAGTLNAQSADRFARATIGGLAVFVPILTLHFAFAPPPEQVIDGTIIWSSAVPGMLSVRHLGIWSGAVLGLSLGLLWTTQDNAKRLGWVAASIALSSALLCWSGTRGGVVGVGAAFCITAIMARSLPSITSMITASGALALGAYASTWWLPPDYSFGLFGAMTREFNGAAQYSGGRFELWLAMMQQFANHPLFGVGEGSIFWLTPHLNQQHVQPHNAVVQFLSSWGLVACIPALYLAVRMWWSAHQPARTHRWSVSVLLMVNSLIVMSMFDGALYFSRFIMLIAAGFALALAVSVQENAKATAL
jgi:exopolysaccharide production protein ExoQ